MNEFMKALSWSQTEETAVAVNDFLSQVQRGERPTDEDGWVDFKFLKFREDPEAPGMLYDVQSPDGKIQSWGSHMLGAAIAQTIIMARLGDGVASLKKEAQTIKKAGNEASLN